MYTIEAGIGWKVIYRKEIPDVLTAMDEADNLYNEGFNFIFVYSISGDREYTVEDFTPRTVNEREERFSKALHFIKENKNDG